MKRIALIGAGQLGSRHLQGLAKLQLPAVLEVVDPNLDSLSVAQKRFQKISNSLHISIHFYQSIQELSKQIDLCIISTNADVRLKVLQELLQTRKVRFCVLEKILVQSVEDLQTMTNLLYSNNVITWVNFGRRVTPFYQEIKPFFRGEDCLQYHIEGANWGICCNTLHLLDHLAYFTGESLNYLDTSGLKHQIYTSKRNDFIEFRGTLRGVFSRGSQIILEDVEKEDSAHLITIVTKRWQFDIHEIQQTAKLISKKEQQLEREWNFALPLQSEATPRIVQEILTRGNCTLTPFRESALIHAIFLKAMTQHLERITQQSYDRCPIT